MTETQNLSSQATQLQKLEELENSLKTIETRIQYLVKEQFKNQKNVQKVMKSSIAKIGHKATQAKFHVQIRKLHEKENLSRSVMHSSIMQHKEKQKKDITSIKQTILVMKKSETHALRQISKKNEQIIRESRRKQVDSRKSTIQEIRFLRSQTKKELGKKRQEEEKEHLKKKEEEMASRLRQKNAIESKICQLLNLENRLVSKIQESQKTAQTLRDVANQSIKIPKDQFYKIIKEVQKEKGRHIGEQATNQAVFDRFMKMMADLDLDERQKRVKTASTINQNKKQESC